MLKTIELENAISRLFHGEELDPIAEEIMDRIDYEAKRFLLACFPYVLFVLTGTKLGQSWRYAPGVGPSEKLIHLVEGMAAAFQSAMPSFLLFDLFVGIIFAAIIWIAVYIRGRNAKKFRKNQEYGSARWSA